jgi:hypothetical protein
MARSIIAKLTFGIAVLASSDALADHGLELAKACEQSLITPYYHPGRSSPSEEAMFYNGLNFCNELANQIRGFDRRIEELERRKN